MSRGPNSYGTDPRYNNPDVPRRRVRGVPPMPEDDEIQQGQGMQPPQPPGPSRASWMVGVGPGGQSGQHGFQQGGSGGVLPWQGPPIGGNAHFGPPKNPLMAPPPSGGYNYMVPGSQRPNYQPPNPFGGSSQAGAPQYGPQMGGYGMPTGNPNGLGGRGNGDPYSPLPPWAPQPPRSGTVDDRTAAALKLYDSEAREGQAGLMQQLSDMGLAGPRMRDAGGEGAGGGPPPFAGRGGWGAPRPEPQGGGGGRGTPASFALARYAGYRDIGRQGLIGQLGESDRAYGLQLGGLGLRANQMQSDQDYRERLLRQSQYQNAPPPWSTLHQMTGYGQGQGRYIPGFGWTG